MMCSSKASVTPAWRPKKVLVVIAATVACATRCNSFAFSSRHKLPNKQHHVTFRRSDHLASRMPHVTAPHRGSRHRLWGRMGFSDGDNINETKMKPSPLNADAYDVEYSTESKNNNKSDVSISSSLSPAFVALREKFRAFLLVVALLLSFFVGPQNASAVSGGRMGGSFGGSSSRSRSYSAPSRSYSSPSRSYSSPSRSYSSPSRSYSRGYNQGGYSRGSNIIVSPVISPMYRPWYSPFGGPSYYGSPTGAVVSSGPSFVGIFFFAAFVLFAVNTFSNVGSDVMDSIGSSADSLLGSGVTVAEISVAIDVPDRDSHDSILSALNRLSRTAKTDSRVGLQNLTSQVALEILRRQTSIVAAFTKSSHYKDETKAQREYNGISFEERGKFSKETVSKYGGVDYSDSRKEEVLAKYSSSATVAVITVIVLIDGDSTKLPIIRSISDVKDALGRIAADVKVDDCLRSAEILWTPEERDETLTMRDVFADYPSLRSI